MTARLHCIVRKGITGILVIIELQKQPPRVVLKKRCSENMQQIYRGILMMPTCDFNNVAKQLY